MGNPMIKFNPPAPLTHRELLIDFVDMPPNANFAVNISGPLAQPFWATLKSDPIGQAQLFWRTQSPGDYVVRAKGPDGDIEAGFSVTPQAGEPDVVLDADVKTVEPEPEPEPEPKKAAPKPRARRKTSAKRTTGPKGR